MKRQTRDGPRLTRMNGSVLIMLANVMVLVAVVVFASGFFPHKPFMPGSASYDALGGIRPPTPPFDKVIFMVIDALRR